MAILVQCPNPQCRHRQYEDNVPCKKCGIPLKKASRKVFLIEYYHEGRKRREMIGTSRSLAETTLRKRLVERAEGKLLDRKPVNNHRFSDLSKRYNEWSKANNKSYEVNKKYYISKVTDHFNQILLRSITSWDIEKFKSDRLKQTGLYEVNRELACLKHMLAKGIEWGLLQANPAKTVKKFKEGRGRIRFLMPDEFNKLYEQLPSPLNDIAKVSVLTGLRKDNVLSLEWPFIDLQNHILNVPDTKNGESLKLPLCQAVIDLLNGLPRRPESPYVFPREDGQRYQNINFKEFKEATKRAGLEEGVLFHTLRHSAASHLVMAGIDLTTVKELLGHKDISMTMRYSHLAPDHKRNAVEILGKLFSVGTKVGTKPDEAQKKVIALPR